MSFEGVVPILRVADLTASIDYYTNILGFELQWQEPGVFASIIRDEVKVFLAQGDQGNPGSWIWIGVDDAEQLCKDYRAKGAKIRHPPTNYTWAYEMQVEDPDGNVLRMGSEPKENEPFGEWFDMHGRRWRPAGDGWVEVKDDQ
jgi:catechol 2,3-dioxygenase-like lactoylglutathione lyase family enzyme